MDSEDVPDVDDVELLLPQPKRDKVIQPADTRIKSFFFIFLL